MSKEIIGSRFLPRAVGPYSQTVVFNDLILISGQVAMDPETGKIEKGDIRKQTALILKNIKNMLQDVGSSLENILKVNIYMKDLSEFDDMNEVYAQFFRNNYPARCTVEVSKLFNDFKIEIEVIATK